MEDLQALQAQLVAWRHALHRHPETGFEEVATARLVADALRALGLDVHTGIGGTGIVANLTVGDGAGVIGLRADMAKWTVALVDLRPRPKQAPCMPLRLACLTHHDKARSRTCASSPFPPGLPLSRSV